MASKIVTPDTHVSFQDLAKAYKKCRLGKRPSLAQIRFETRLGRELIFLEREIRMRTYSPSPYHCFSVSHPKPREIFAAQFRDRIIHHCILDKLEKDWEKRFYAFSFACRKNQGPLKALQYLKRKSHSVFLNVSSTWGLCSGLIPAEKSLFFRPDNEGLPIGNLTSQFGANVYLNSLDHFISRKLRPLAYLRYMDDLTLLGTSQEELLALIQPIDDFLLTKRRLKLNPQKTQLTNIQEKEIRYLGLRLRKIDEDLKLHLPPNKKWNFINALKRHEALGHRPALSPHPLAPRIYPKTVKKGRAQIEAHLGYMKQAATVHFRKKALQMGAFHAHHAGTTDPRNERSSRCCGHCC